MAVKGPTGRALGLLVRVSCAYPTVTVVLAGLLTAASLWYAATNLGLATSTRALLPQGLPYVERFVEYDREFGELDDLVIVVEARSLPEATVYATRLVRELRIRQAPLRRIAYRIDPKQFEGRALLYLSTDRLKEIRDRIFDYQEFLEKFAERPTLDQLVDGIATSIAQGTEDWHKAPAKTFTINVVGDIEGEVGDGTRVKIGKGDLVYLEDLTGKGHVTRLLTPVANLFIRMKPDFDFLAWASATPTKTNVWD